jgi:hypothetical protein
MIVSPFRDVNAIDDIFPEKRVLLSVAERWGSDALGSARGAEPKVALESLIRLG